MDGKLTEYSFHYKKLFNPVQINNSASYLVPAWLSVLLPRHHHVHHSVTQGGSQVHLPPQAGQHDGAAGLGHCETGLHIDVRYRAFFLVLLIRERGDIWLFITQSLKFKI